MADVCECASSAPAEPTTGRSLRIALLVLLKKRGDHGYELYRRMQVMGYTLPNATRIYRLLRTMESEGLVSASWELSERGPARRTYTLNPDGDRYLRTWVPSVLAERDALKQVLALYRRLVKGCQA
ncbi:MAG: PadR family transcriptional regulator [Acidimicrobiales bacterium]